MTRRIGIDFDNTIVNYDDVFTACGVEAGLLPVDFSGNKLAVRDTIRAQPNGNWRWTELQARVYGVEIRRAEPFAGVREFLLRAVASGCTVCVISQKSRFAAADPGGVDLREAALSWLRMRGFIEPAGPFAPAAVFFECDRRYKLERIAQARCTDFVDDLSEVLHDPAFPSGVRRYHFVGSTDSKASGFSSWTTISDAIFGAS